MKTVIGTLCRHLCSREDEEFVREKDNIVISDYRRSATWLKGRARERRHYAIKRL